MNTPLVHQGIIVPKNIFLTRMIMNIRKNNNVIEAVLDYLIDQGFAGIELNKEDFKVYKDIEGLLGFINSQCQRDFVIPGYIVECISYELYWFIGVEIDLFEYLCGAPKIKSLEVIFNELHSSNMPKIPLFEDYRIKTYFGPLGSDIIYEEENDKL